MKEKFVSPARFKSSLRMVDDGDNICVSKLYNTYARARFSNFVP